MKTYNITITASEYNKIIAGLEHRAEAHQIREANATDRGDEATAYHEERMADSYWNLAESLRKQTSVQ